VTVWSVRSRGIAIISNDSQSISERIPHEDNKCICPDCFLDRIGIAVARTAKSPWQNEVEREEARHFKYPGKANVEEVSILGEVVRYANLPDPVNGNGIESKPVTQISCIWDAECLCRAFKDTTINKFN